jgi:hypothetical protein
VEISGLSSEQWQENPWNMGIRHIIADELLAPNLF